MKPATFYAYVVTLPVPWREVRFTADPESAATIATAIIGFFAGDAVAISRNGEPWDFAL